MHLYQREDSKKGNWWLGISTPDGKYLRMSLKTPDRDVAERVAKLRAFELVQQREIEVQRTFQRIMDSAKAGATRKGDDRWVYFLRDSAEGHIKIGCAKNVSHRLQNLQTGHPGKLALLGTEPGGGERERFLHAVFSNDRIKGEWFTASSRLLAYIDAVCNPDAVVSPTGDIPKTALDLR